MKENFTSERIASTVPTNVTTEGTEVKILDASFTPTIPTSTNAQSTESESEYTTVSETSKTTPDPPSIEGWKKVDGWFAEYPLSLGMNRFHVRLDLTKIFT